MLSTNVEFSLTRMQGAWDLTANLKESADNTDAVIALILQMSRISYGNDLTPLEVHLIRSAPEDTSPLDDFLVAQSLMEKQKTAWCSVPQTCNAI